MENSRSASCVLLVLWCLLQTQDCRGQDLIGSSQPIFARVGDDVILPCSFQTPRNAASLILEWIRPDLDPSFVLVWRKGDVREIKNKQFVDRTFLFQDEMKHGNISLKLTNVKPEDSGVYRCFIPLLGKGPSVKLIIGSSSSVMASVASVNLWGTGVVLQCVSRGWFPEPELWWMDSEGRLLSVERTLSLSDGLYDVSSSVTVEQSGPFSCTVTQSSTNLTEQSRVQVPDNIFGVKMFPVIISLTAGLVVFAGVTIISLILLWRTKQNISQTNELKSSRDEETSLQIRSLEEENQKFKDKLIQEVKRLRELSESKSPVIINSFDPSGRSVCLKKQSSALVLNVKDWSVHIEVDNKTPLIYTFDCPLTLRREDELTIWAEGFCPENGSRHNDKEWEKQGPWNSGDIAVVSLYDKNNELKDRICEWMYPAENRADSDGLQ